MSSSPGYTDWPEVDIKTHRSIARDMRVFAVLSIPVGLYSVATMDVAAWGPGVVFFMFAASAASLDYQAQKWEDQLEEGDDARDDDV